MNVNDDTVSYPFPSGSVRIPAYSTPGYTSSDVIIPAVFVAKPVPLMLVVVVRIGLPARSTKYQYKYVPSITLAVCTIIGSQMPLPYAPYSAITSGADILFTVWTPKLVLYTVILMGDGVVIVYLESDA